MNLKEILYLRGLREVKHTTLNPNGPGVVRIHLVPPKQGVRNGISAVILNGKDILPLKPAWTIMLAEMIDQINRFYGHELGENELRLIKDRTLAKMKSIYRKTDENVLKGDLAILVKALLDVSCKTARVRHKLAHGFNLCALKSHSSCHDKTDITGAENNNLFTGHISLHINVLLRGTRGENACRTSAGSIERSSGALAAAHCKDECAEVNVNNAARIYANECLFTDLKSRGLGHQVDAGHAAGLFAGQVFHRPYDTAAVSGNHICCMDDFH